MIHAVDLLVHNICTFYFTYDVSCDNPYKLGASFTWIDVQDRQVMSNVDKVQ